VRSSTQMNMYISTSVSARNEITEMSGIHNWFISHAYSSPAYIGEVDDSIVGSFELTRSNVRLDKYHAMLLFANTSYLPIFENRIYTGRDIITKMLEPTPITFSRDTTWYDQKYAGVINYDPTEIKVNIDHGIHKSGVLDSSSIGSKSKGGLFHIIASDYGTEQALLSMFDLQQLSIGYIEQFGFSIGIMDILIPKETRAKIHDIETTIMNDAQLITDRLNRGEIIPPIGKTSDEFYEELQISKLRVLDDFADPIIRAIDTDTNSLFKLIKSGSKGRMQHMFHISSAIGQILINEQRPRQKFSYRRTLPYFKRFDTDPQSRGYITNSYLSGMDIVQELFNAMNARFDFITKALSTSVTGEQNRKSIKNLESIIVNNLRMCVKGSKIIQFIYGEDGVDPRALLDVKFPTVMLSAADLEKQFRYVPRNKKYASIYDSEFERMKTDREEYRRRFLALEQSNVNEPLVDKRPLPVDVDRLIAILRADNPMTPADEASLAGMTVRVNKFCQQLPYILLNEAQIDKYISDVHISAVWLLTMSIRTALCARRMEAYDDQFLTLIFNMIRMKYLIAFVDYGTAVGIISAQSFSAPLTQYMLDAQHRSVSGGTSKSGMDRVKEVMGARETDRLKASSMLIAVDSAIAHDRTKVQEMANRIEVMILQQFVVAYQVFFEKYGEPTHPAYVDETKIMKEFEKYNPLMKIPNDLVNWCVRFDIDKSALILKNMPLESIIIRLREEFPFTYIVYTPENAPKVIIRVYFRSAMFKLLIDDNIMDAQAKSLLKTIIRGVDSINGTEVVKMNRYRIAADDSLERDKDLYGIRTLGTNMSGILNISQVDRNRVQTDAIDETFKMFGVEAARQRIVSELRQLGDGAGINYRHFTVYADEMTYTGMITSIERGGLNKREINNVLLRLGFVAPLHTLEEAAMNAMEDDVSGITAKMLVGTTPEIGTSYNQFYVNEEFVAANTVKADQWLDAL